MTNQQRLSSVAMIIVLTSLFVGCSRGIHGGDVALPLSNSNGTARVFAASESTVLTAISNAFTNADDNPNGYRGMCLTSSSESSYGTNWRASNAFVLFPLIAPITNVPLRGSPPVFVPYSACFNITLKAVDNSNTSVLIRTIFAKVIDGEETGVHGGWAHHSRDVSPVRMEEENVLNAISNTLNVLQMQQGTNR
jgi:hypothetical protein